MRLRSERLGPRTPSGGIRRRAHLPPRRGVIAVIFSGIVLASTLLAGPVLRLKDGRELKGVDLRREEGLYLLEIAGGSVIPVPNEAVKEVEWIETGDAGSSASREPIVARVTGRTEEEARQAEERAAARDRETKERETQRRAEEEQAAEKKEQEEKERRAQYYGQYDQGGANVVGGQVLAGPPIRPPTTAEQLAVFGEPAKFAQDVVHFDLQPSYWVPDPEEAMGSPSEFMQPPRDSTWVPTDGFAKSGF